MKQKSRNYSLHTNGFLLKLGRNGRRQTGLDPASSANEPEQMCDGVWVKCAYAVCLKLERGHFARIDCGAM